MASSPNSPSERTVTAASAGLGFATLIASLTLAWLSATTRTSEPACANVPTEACLSLVLEQKHLADLEFDMALGLGVASAASLLLFAYRSRRQRRELQKQGS